MSRMEKDILVFEGMLSVADGMVCGWHQITAECRKLTEKKGTLGCSVGCPQDLLIHQTSPTTSSRF